MFCKTVWRTRNPQGYPHGEGGGEVWGVPWPARKPLLPYQPWRAAVEEQVRRKFPPEVSVFDSYCCCNNHTQDGFLKNAQSYHLTDLDVRSPNMGPVGNKSRHWQGCGPLGA